MGIESKQFAIASKGSVHVWNLYETREAAQAAIPEANRYTGKAHEVISDVDAWFREAERSAVTKAERIDEDQYYYLLEVLPPMNWHTFDGLDVFFLSEFDFMGVTQMVARSGDDYASKRVIYRDKSTWITNEEMRKL